MCRVWLGLTGCGERILLGEMARPLGMSMDSGREWRLEWRELDEGLACVDAGTSRMLSCRPVVGSIVESLAGSWETW